MSRLRFWKPGGLTSAVLPREPQAGARAETKRLVRRTFLIRLGGLAAIAGGVVYAGVSLMEEHPLAEYLYYMGNIGSGFIAILLPVGAMAAIAALHAMQRELYGWAGAVVSVLAFAGLGLATGALTVGVVSTSPNLDSLFIMALIGLLIASVGIALLGGMSIATGILPWWCGVALIIGSPVGVFLTMIPAAALGGTSPLGGAFQALGGVPWMLVGYAVFRAGRRRPQQLPHA
jgi:hypothetical protein